VVDNYLAAHGVCNRYRWHWSSQEFQFILKLDVWARKQMVKQTPIGKKMGEYFRGTKGAELDAVRHPRPLESSIRFLAGVLEATF
jgi:hypothetical protein